uniref:Protein kinase domain-containing protein n=1 Tax=Kalanchoe fedtschenkoi TaxID=63787 RepID=A0A7N0VIN0_KALFE
MGGLLHAPVLERDVLLQDRARADVQFVELAGDFGPGSVQRGVERGDGGAEGRDCERHGGGWVREEAVRDEDHGVHFAADDSESGAVLAGSAASDCELCLNASIARLPSCCFGKQGGRVLKPSCSIRSEIYSFYADPPVLATPPSPDSEPDVQTPDPVTGSGDAGVSTGVIVAIVVALGLGTIVAVFVVWYCFLSGRQIKKSDAGNEENGDHMMDGKSLQFSLDTVQAATKGFSQENKIGEGGFGGVYLGLLSNGTRIAVKRLSNCSGQGAREFKNEVLLVAKLQHRNLVRLLGFCLEGPERILIYDYVPNKSLDQFLFDPEKRRLLDWPRRYMIISGIARGMLYLHEDSPLKILHRDLKAGNVLLDENMNPKIADFGTARIVGVDQSQINTNRIVGTFGYMPPEYVRHGHYSSKSDVYSFGVLVLEIISGKRNGNICQSDEVVDFLMSYAWKNWTNGSPLELLDSSVGDNYSRNEVLKCIHMALLCAQEDLSNRPTMQTVMLMLNSSSVSMPRPQKPSYIL